LRQAKLLDVRIAGDKILRKKASKVEVLTEEIKEFINDLILTMYEDDGIGMAAPQVGRSLRIFVVDPFWYKDGNKKNPVVLINPEFISFSGESEGEEGCLSVPGIYGKVKRAEKVVIKALNEKFEPVQYEAEDTFATVLQHENDHLDGILFIDKIPPLQKILIHKKIKEIESTTNDQGENIISIKNEDQ
jgi:peptide deformylase